MGAGLAQQVPLFSKIDVKIGFRPKDPAAKAANRATEQSKMDLGEWFNAAAAADAMNIFGHKAGFRGAFGNEAESVGIPRNLHLPTPPAFSIDRTKFRGGGCPMNVVPLSVREQRFFLDKMANK